MGGKHNGKFLFEKDQRWGNNNIRRTATLEKESGKDTFGTGRIILWGCL